MRSSCALLLLLIVVVLVIVDAQFDDFRQPDAFYRTARRALRKTDWALRRGYSAPLLPIASVERLQHRTVIQSPRSNGRPAHS